MADTPDLGSGAFGLGGSSPPFRIFTPLVALISALARLVSYLPNRFDFCLTAYFRASLACAPVFFCLLACSPKTASDLDLKCSHAPTFLAQTPINLITPQQLTQLLNLEDCYFRYSSSAWRDEQIDFLRQLTSAQDRRAEDGSEFQFGRYTFFTRTLPAQKENTLVRKYQDKIETVLDINNEEPEAKINTLAISDDGEMLAYTSSLHPNLIVTINLSAHSRFEFPRQFEVSRLIWGGQELFVLEAVNQLKGVSISQCNLQKTSCSEKISVSNPEQQLLLSLDVELNRIKALIISPNHSEEIILFDPYTKIDQSDNSDLQLPTKATESSPIVQEIQNFSSQSLVLASCHSIDCLWLRDANGKLTQLQLPLQLARIKLSPNLNRNSKFAQFALESFDQPSSTYQVNLSTGEIEPLKQSAISRCRVSDFEVEARDRKKIPVTLCLPEEGKAPKGIVLIAYGAYGTILKPSFAPQWPLLLERNYAIALVHVRGGGEYGEQWHKSATAADKIISAYDLIDVGRQLKKQDLTIKADLGVWARSAGAFTVGMAIALEPELFKAAILESPFMQPDPEHDTLAASEKDEWGSINPIDLLDKSPASKFPAILILAGSRDAVVNPLAAIKWLHALRLKTNTGAPQVVEISGTREHDGETGIFEQLQSSSAIAAFYELNLN